MVRVVYLAQDRMDLAVSLSLGHWSGEAEVSDEARTKLVGKYFKGHPSYRQLYRGQTESSQVTVRTDSDSALCPTT